MRRSVLFLLCASVLALSSCAGTGGGLNSLQKTNQLVPGMKPQEVKAVLGEPSQSQFIGDQWVWKYYLHQSWKGFVPFYLVFSRSNPTLHQWFANEAEYYRQQQLWLQAFPPTQRHEIELQLKK